MTEYEFKKGLLKSLRELTGEVRALREVLSRTDEDRKIIQEVKETESLTKTRKFKCTHCGWEDYTDKYKIGTDGAGKKFPYIYCAVCGMPIRETKE